MSLRDLGCGGSDAGLQGAAQARPFSLPRRRCSILLPTFFSFLTEQTKKKPQRCRPCISVGPLLPAVPSHAVATNISTSSCSSSGYKESLREALNQAQARRSFSDSGEEIRVSGAIASSPSPSSTPLSSWSPPCSSPRPRPSSSSFARVLLRLPASRIVPSHSPSSALPRYEDMFDEDDISKAMSMHNPSMFYRIAGKRIKYARARTVRKRSFSKASEVDRHLE
ncbi:uncharacterized protein LOC124664820 [Lolium rigidum]|uniref:uncharacterized protein LOC124664820 n=1 Tax=Lolium rigidum TaxID=89674 RepID=UPI001F5CA871|nr:uncharacterized protein LOC124664820 [Lolium rigidum]